MSYTTAMYILQQPFERHYGACWLHKRCLVVLTTLRLTVRLSSRTVPLNRLSERLRTKGRFGCKLSWWLNLLWTARCWTQLCCHRCMLPLDSRCTCLWTTWMVCTLYRLCKSKYKAGRDFLSWCSITYCKCKHFRRSTLTLGVGMLNMHLAIRFFYRQRTYACMGPGNLGTILWDRLL